MIMLFLMKRHVPPRTGVRPAKLRPPPWVPPEGVRVGGVPLGVVRAEEGLLPPAAGVGVVGVGVLGAGALTVRQPEVFTVTPLADMATSSATYGPVVTIPPDEIAAPYPAPAKRTVAPRKTTEFRGPASAQAVQLRKRV